LDISTTIESFTEMIFFRLSTLNMSVDVDVSRIWSLLRSVSASISTNFDVSRIWSLLREVSVSISTDIEVSRIWSLLREVSASISTSFDVYAELTASLEQFYRYVTLSISTNFDVERTWSLLREVSLDISTTIDVLREIMISRVVNVNLGVTVESWASKVSVYLREVTVTFTTAMDGYGWLNPQYWLDLLCINAESLEVLPDTIVNVYQVLGNGTKAFLFTDKTNATGYITGQLITSGTHEFVATLEAFLPEVIMFNIEGETLVTLSLLGLEDAIVIDLPMFILFLFSMTMTLLFWFIINDPALGALSALGWVSLTLYWVYMGTEPYTLAWIWFVMFVTEIFLTMANIFEWTFSLER